MEVCVFVGCTHFNSEKKRVEIGNSGWTSFWQQNLKMLLYSLICANKTMFTSKVTTKFLPLTLWE